jgi:heterodisulfide reductase subunit A
MDPNVDNMTLSAVFGVDLNRWGYIDKKSAYLHTGETSRPGILVAGAATGPETIDDSIAQGHAAAVAALNMLRSPAKVAAE